jgi:threonine/homoserine/homoserine lactone efflux protein
VCSPAAHREAQRTVVAAVPQARRVMGQDQFAALIAFAAVASFTPGPNNTIAAATGANFGLRAVLPHVFGVPVGFSSMLLATTGGVAALLLATPTLATLLKWIGVAYLLWLSWQLVRPTAVGTEPASGPFSLPLGFAQSAVFQYLNPKAWMFALATATAFVNGEAPLQRAAVVVVICAVFTFLSLLLWGWLGAALRGWLAHNSRLRVFNVTMGLLLAATALWMGITG